jgi:hypothetical protein
MNGGQKITPLCHDRMVVALLSKNKSTKLLGIYGEKN